MFCPFLQLLQVDSFLFEQNQRQNLYPPSALLNNKEELTFNPEDYVCEHLLEEAYGGVSVFVCVRVCVKRNLKVTSLPKRECAEMHMCLYDYDSCEISHISQHTRSHPPNFIPSPLLCCKIS